MAHPVFRVFPPAMLVGAMTLSMSAAQTALAPSRLVVLDMRFYGRGANSLEPGDPDLAVEAGHVLRQELARYPGFLVVDSALVAQAIGQAEAGGILCNTIGCARSIGERLGARWVVTSKLSKTSNLIWYMFGQLVEVSSGRLVADQELELKGVSREMAPLGARALSRRLAKAAGVGDGGPPPAVADTPALNADQVKALLAAATEAEPPDLSGKDLSGLDLHGLDFKRGVMTRTRLAGADLSGANLFSCDLTDAILTEAKLPRANLDATTLRRADLRRADLRNASLFATIIEAADLSGADLSGTRIIGYLKKAKLTGAKLQGANIGADPGNQSMGVMRTSFVGADLARADLSGANLFKAELSHASLVDANLAGADLSNGDLIETDFSGADLTNVNLSQADIAGAIFTRARGMKTIKGLAQARNREKAVFDVE